MIIKNKKTNEEYMVSADEWKIIDGNPVLKRKFRVIDSSEIKDYISSQKKSPIILPEEIVNFRKERIEKLKEENKKATTEINPAPQGDEIKKEKKTTKKNKTT